MMNFWDNASWDVTELPYVTVEVPAELFDVVHVATVRREDGSVVMDVWEGLIP